MSRHKGDNQISFLYFNCICLKHQGVKIDFFTSFTHTTYTSLGWLVNHIYIRESVLYMWFIAVWNVLHMCTRVQRSLIFFFSSCCLWWRLNLMMKSIPHHIYIIYVLLQSKMKRENVKHFFPFSLSIISSNISIVFNCVSFFLSSWSSPGNDTVE